MLEHYSAANFLNSKNTNRSLIFLEFILAGLLQCKKQTKNNAAAEKAFPDLERDHRLCTHYVAFRYRVQSSATNRQPQGAQKFGHPEHLAPAVRSPTRQRDYFRI